MENKILTTQELNDFVDSVIESGVETHGVQYKEPDKAFNKFCFGPLKNAGDMAWHYDITLESPKKFFMPDKETLFKFRKDGEIKLSPIFETNKRVLFGVHPYDMIAINQMDEVWQDKYEDFHYMKRRRNTVIVGLDPQKSSAHSFWCLMDAGSVDKGYDVWLTKLDDDTYFVELASDAGAELFNKHAGGNNATEDNINKRDHIRTVLHKQCNPERKMSAKAGEIPLLVMNNWDHKVWEEKAAKCYSCGACNLVCPTCYCFDVKDDIELNLKDGKRERIWDGCQLEGFAAVAENENFRKHRADRFKHRFYRKTVYQYQRYNQLACVGCGRCASACLPNIADPVDIINTLKEGR